MTVNTIIWKGVPFRFINYTRAQGYMQGLRKYKFTYFREPVVSYAVFNTFPERYITQVTVTITCKLCNITFTRKYTFFIIMCFVGG